jgi:APA family basic amino acid/polyamine antiporter
MTPVPADPSAATPPGPTPPAAAPPTEELRRVIGVWDAAALVVGLIIGSGIFRAPASVARELPTAALMLAAWVIGGLLSLAGGLAAAELGVRYPKSGGQYVFLREAFGPGVSFAFGWSNVLISRPSLLAGVALVFAGYFAPLFGLPDSSHKALAIAAVALLTLVNCLGVKAGTRAQNLFTAAKVLGLALLGVAALASGRGSAAHFAGAAAAPLAHPLPVAMALGLITILFTYDGWIDVTYAGGEVARPGHTFPRAILIGTLGCMALYLLANVAYIYLLNPGDMPGAENIAALALERAFGPAGARTVSVLVMISTLGILNGSILTSTRVPYAMARDGVMFPPLGRVHPRTHSPVNSLVAIGLFTCVCLLLVPGFDTLADLFVTTTWFFYAVCFIGLLILQRRERRTGAPSGTGEGTYRMPFSPWPAVLFSAVTLFIVGISVVQGAKQVLLAFAIIALGIPVYRTWQAVRARGRARTGSATS